MNHHAFVQNKGAAFLNQRFFQVHFLFVFQTNLFEKLNVNADHCILHFLDRGHFEVWIEIISKQNILDKINLKD